MPKLYDAEGKPVELPEAEARAAIQSGQLFAAADQLYDVTNPDGQITKVSGADLFTALQPGNGYTLVSPEAVRAEELRGEVTSLPGVLRTAGEEALSTATLGGYDVLAGELGGDDYREKRRLGQELNPFAAGAGTAAGVIAPALLSGGGSLLGEAGLAGKAVMGAGKAVTAPSRLAMALGEAAGGLVPGTGILAQGARLGLTGAVEGAAFGAGDALSEAALAPGGDYDHLAERIWAGAAHGGLTGAAIGGGLGLTGAALGKAVQRGQREIFSAENLQKHADEFGAKALGLRASDLANVPEDVWRSKVRDVLKMKLDDGTDLVRAGDKVEQIAPKLRQAQGEIGEKLGAIRRDVDQAIEATGRKDLALNMSGFRAEAQKWLGDIQATGTRSERIRAARALREFDQVIGAGEVVPGVVKRGAAGQLERRGLGFEEAIKFRGKIDNVIKPPSKGGMQFAPENQAQLHELRTMFDKTIDEQMEKAVRELLPQRAGAHGVLKGQYATVASLAKAANRAASGETMKSALGAFESLSGVGGTVASIASGSVLPVLGAAALSGVRRVARDRGDSVLAVMMSRAAQADSKVAAGVRRFFAGSGRAARRVVQAEAAPKPRTDVILGAKVGETRVAAYQRKLQKLHAWSPMELERSLGHMMGVAPGTVMAMSSAAKRGVDYLKAEAPSGLVDTNQIIPTHPAPPNDFEISRWARKVETVEDPLVVVDKLEDGTLTKEHVDALRVVSPKLYEDIKQQTMIEIADRGVPLNYDEAIMLGTLLDLPTMKALEPGRLREIQDSYAALAQARAEQIAADPVTETSNIVNQFRTGVQQLEAGEFSL